MDLLSSIHKEGSRGGVNFSWSDVTTSQHRENYLGHSVMAPVGRWQKGKDLTWYAKADNSAEISSETIEEKRIRERKEEIKKIKEAEEDALARALGLPVQDRKATGSNSVTLGEVKKAVKDAGVGEDEGVKHDQGFGKRPINGLSTQGTTETSKDYSRHDLRERTNKMKDRSDSPEEERKYRRKHRHHNRHRHRSNSPERERRSSHPEDRHRRLEREEGKPRKRSIDRSYRKDRIRSPDRDRRKIRKEFEIKSRRSRSPEARHRRY